MKALLCTQFGGPELLELQDVEAPTPGEKQVLLDVKACSVNFTDLLQVQDKYQYKQTPPYIPGGEVAGVVRAVGPGVTNVAVGDRVIGNGQIGGFAEQVVRQAAALRPIPDGIGFAEASGIMYAYGTALHALRDRAELKAGQSLLVLGAAGAVGLAAVEVGKVMGARVIAAASSAEKLARCRERGADETVNYETEDVKTVVREMTGGEGADVVYDPVGGKYAEPALRATAWEGKFLVVGFAAGDIPRIPLNLPLLRGCSVVGVFWGAFSGRYPDRARETNEQLVKWWQERKLQPYVSATFPLARAGEALQSLADRQAIGRVVVVVD